jgi:hypothetical protein
VCGVVLDGNRRKHAPAMPETPLLSPSATALAISMTSNSVVMMLWGSP